MTMITRLIYAAITLLLITGSARAEYVHLEKGDVYCVGYDAATNSCALKGTVLDMIDGSGSSAEELVMTDTGQALTITLFVKWRREGDLNCMIPGSVHVTASPENHMFGPLMSNMTAGIIKEYARNSYCAGYRVCGDQIAALAHLKGKRLPANDMLFTLIPAGDARLETLTARPVHSAEVDEFKGSLPVECLPVM